MFPQNAPEAKFLRLYQRFQAKKVVAQKCVFPAGFAPLNQTG